MNADSDQPLDGSLATFSTLQNCNKTCTELPDIKYCRDQFVHGRATKSQHWPFRSSPADITDRVLHEERPSDVGVGSSDVNRSTPMVNQVDGGTETRGTLSSGPSRNPERKGKDIVSEHGYGLRKSLRLSHASEHVSALEIHRTTNQRILQQALEMNNISASLFGAMENFIDSLENLSHNAEALPSTPDPSQNLNSNFARLRQKLGTLLEDEVPNVQTLREKVAFLQRNLIESIRLSNRYLDRVFKPNTPTLSFSPSLEPTLSFPRNEVDLEGETYARSTSVVQYLAQKGEVDAIQEKLTDLYLERDQLRDEQESRARFGLSLDDESLDFLGSVNDREGILLNELEYAEQVMEALGQLIRDSEALQITNESYIDNIDQDWELLDPVEATTVSPPPAGGGQPPLLSDLRNDHMTFADLYDFQGPASADSARFINTWILDRARSLPNFLGKLTAMFERQYHGIQPEDLKSRFLELWFQDSAATDFRRNRTQADEQSVETNRAYSDDPIFEGDAALTTRLEPWRLLQLGPDTKAEDIIAQAVRTRAATPARTLNQ